MELLVARHVSGAPVVSGGEVVGVVSATDLLAFAAGVAETSSSDSAEGEPDDAPASLSEEETPATYFTEMRAEDRSDVTERLDPGASRSTALDTHTVAEAMTGPPVLAMSPGTPVDAAADYMRQAQIHRVLVMTGQRLHGIVTTTDIANAVADHRIAKQTYVFDGPRGVFRGGRT
jgi:CBS domain-containing protein